MTNLSDFAVAFHPGNHVELHAGQATIRMLVHGAGLLKGLPMLVLVCADPKCTSIQEVMTATANTVNQEEAYLTRTT